MTLGDAPAELVVGTVIAGKLEIVAALGAGGMASVYEAKNLRTGRHVALKMLRRELAEDAELCRRFLNEALACGRIRHGNVVDVLDADVHEGRPYLLMELLRGETLAARMRGGPIPSDHAVDWALAACAGLAAAHAAGVVHRDLKPDNLFLAITDDGDEVMKVVDFGISKLLDDGDALHTTRTGTVVGTPLYMAPEQARGLKDLDERADVWAVGAVLYEMLTGRPPFVADNYNQLIASLLTERPEPPSAFRKDLSPALEAVVLGALARERNERYGSIAELAQALSDAVERPRPSWVRSTSRPGLADIALGDTLAATPTPDGGPTPDVTPTPNADAAETPKPAPAADPERAQPAARARSPRAPLVLGGAALAIGAALTYVIAIGTTDSASDPDATSDDASDDPSPATVADPDAVPPMLVDVMMPELAPRRVAVLATRTEGADVDHSVAWTLVARVIEELDRYEELRPTSPAGMLAARVAELDDATALPDELQAQAIARRVGAGTIVSLALTSADGGVRVSTRVYATDDLDRFETSPAEIVGMSDLDGDAVERVSERVTDALRHQLGIDALSAMQLTQAHAGDHAFWQRIYEAEELFSIGDYEASLRLTDELLERFPEEVKLLSLRACNLSYLGRDDEATEYVERVRELRPFARTRREQVIIDQDLGWLGAVRATDPEERRRLAQQVLELDLELAHEYGEPRGFLYAAAVQQFLLEDPAAARITYAEARARAPWLYPPYAEEAKLVYGDGSDPRARAEAARVVTTYIQCNPNGRMLDRARRLLREWGLAEIPDRLACPTLRDRPS